jgi:hypothetical protein
VSHKPAAPYPRCKLVLLFPYYLGICLLKEPHVQEDALDITMKLLLVIPAVTRPMSAHTVVAIIMNLPARFGSGY